MTNATRIVATAATALALAAPTAVARPAVEAPTHDSPAYVEAPAAPAPTSSSGFDWGDAAIGAGGVLGLVVLFSAGAAVAGRARALPTR
jgi:hypothetical protein